MAAPVFHTLTVADVAPLTDDAVAVTFDIPDHLVEDFRYLPGQHVTIRTSIGDEDIRRSYSICADATQGILRVGIKRLGGGVFSTWATSELAPGTEIEVMPPVGEFTIEPDPDAANHYGAIVAGSGITPVLAQISTTLAAEPASRWTLVYGNRTASSVMFLEELEALKDRYRERLHLVHVLSREDTIVPLFAGRLDADRLTAIFDTVVDSGTVDRWFLCGPYEMVMGAREVLAERGVPTEAIHDELFFAGPVDPSMLEPEPEDEEGVVRLDFTLEGRSSSTRMRPETTILDAAMRVRTELPYSCKGGMCATCKAHVVEGEVTMAKNYALVEEDLAAGFVLTCQAHPVSETIVIDFDRR